MDEIKEQFQAANWDTPGWEYAKEVVTSLASVEVPYNLSFTFKVALLQAALMAATKSEQWLGLLLALNKILTKQSSNEL